MMFFSNMLVGVGVVVLGVVGAFAQSVEDVDNGIMKVIDKSAAAQNSIATLTVTNFPVRGFEIAADIKDIIQTVNSVIADLLPNARAAPSKFAPRATNAFDDEGAEQIVGFLTGLVHVHQRLLNTIIGKRSLAAQFFLTAPIAAGLRGLEAVVDTLAFGIIGLIPTRADDAMDVYAPLAATFQQAITTYQN